MHTLVKVFEIVIIITDQLSEHFSYPNTLWSQGVRITDFLLYIYNMCFHASTTTLNLYANLYYAKTKWLLFEMKDIFQKCNSTIKTLLGLKTAAKDIWSILGRTKSLF